MAWKNQGGPWGGGGGGRGVFDISKIDIDNWLMYKS